MAGFLPGVHRALYLIPSSPPKKKITGKRKEKKRRLKQTLRHVERQTPDIKAVSRCNWKTVLLRLLVSHGGLFELSREGCQEVKVSHEMGECRM